MLNRINLTLSALTNRLNLGTRALALNTSVNTGKVIVRIRPLHHDVMRQVMGWRVKSSFHLGIYDAPPVSGSTLPGGQQRLIRCSDQEASRSACQRCNLPESSRGVLLKQVRPGKHALESLFASAMQVERPELRSAGQAQGSVTAVRLAAAAA
jgi:hypothetical protein